MIKYGLEYLNKEKIKLGGYIFIIYLLAMSTFFTPIISGEIIDIVTQSLGKSLLLRFTILYGLIQLTKIILQYFSNKLSIDIQSNAAFNMNKDIIKHVQYMSLLKLSQYNTGYLNQRINNDCNTVVTFIISIFSELLLNIITFAVSAMYLFNMSKQLFLLLVVALIVYILIYSLLKNKMYKMSLLLKEEQSMFFASLMEQLENVRFIQTHSLQKKFLEKLLCKFTVYKNAFMKAQKFFFLYSSTENIIVGGTQTIIYLIGGYMALKGEISIGEFTIIISFFLYLIQSLKYFSDFGKNYQDNIVSYERLQELLRIDETEGEGGVDKIECIECKNLSFRYKDKIVIKNFNYKFVEGNTYVIKGENGTGKTTVIELLLGLYKGGYEGEIYYNNHNILNLNMNKIRYSKIAVMEQFPFVLGENVADNIYLTDQYVKKNIEGEKDEIPSLLSWVNNSKQINADKSGQSGGERQKIALLRVIAKNASVVILDEPTSSLDKRATDEVIEYLKKKEKNKIIIIVSHDTKILETFKNHILLE